jgi:hypothetical protein
MANVDETTKLYQIKIEGHYEDSWCELYEGFSVQRLHKGDTLLTGSIPDQAALHGLLKKFRDMGITIISINRIKANRR